jgi:hypothetical protein
VGVVVTNGDIQTSDPPRRQHFEHLLTGDQRGGPSCIRASASPRW